MDERKAAANSAQAQPEKGVRLCAKRYMQAGRSVSKTNICENQFTSFIFGSKDKPYGIST